MGLNLISNLHKLHSVGNLACIHEVKKIYFSHFLSTTVTGLYSETLLCLREERKIISARFYRQKMETRKPEEVHICVSREENTSVQRL